MISYSGNYSAFTYHMLHHKLKLQDILIGHFYAVTIFIVTIGDVIYVCEGALIRDNHPIDSDLDLYID